jgi:SAM-dependent methyltransferase
MSLGSVRYNERSWAIDLIGHLKQLAASQHRAVQDAGGEQTVKYYGSSLFPDVLLFGDRSTTRILQGWELKMPDTGIDEPEFRNNAEKKARALGLDSFVLWNVRCARLFALDKASDKFINIKEWTELSDITVRKDVQHNRLRWEALAEKILNQVNELLESGKLEGRQFIEAYMSGGITDLILANTELVAEALRKASSRDVNLKSEIVLWWQRYRDEYGGSDSYQALARANLVNWLGKLLFAHILRERDNRAKAVEQIGDDTTPVQALDFFARLSDDCDFWTIFCDTIGLSVLPAEPWSHLCQFNRLLSDIRVGAVDQQQLSDLLEATASVGSRKLKGQYTTPPELARLLIELSIQDVGGRVLDPCCGSGTISRAALEQKLNHGVTPDKAAASVFAGDLDPHAVQLTTFALVKPSLMRHPLRLFLKDAFSLSPDDGVEFRNPDDGSAFTEKLGVFHAIAVNLPFVAQAGRKPYAKAISEVNGLFDKQTGGLPGGADIAAYLPFSLHRMLEPGGRLGIIITNAWLGTAWGDAFAQRLRYFYHLKAVITSGAGRWFQNSKVVSNILILEKPNPANKKENRDTKFVVLKRHIKELIDSNVVSLTAAQIELGQTQDETMTIHSVSIADLDYYRNYGLSGNAQFVDVGWVKLIPLVPLKSLFDIRRGERRGWDALFYPSTGHNIEAEYIKPVLLSSTDIKKYTTQADGEAFSCSLTLDQLNIAGHKGAIAWIEKFADGTNKTGKPLTVSLAKKGMQWYEMQVSELAELALPINFGDRLYVARLATPAFLNQRLIRLNTKDNVDLDLCHALLNSTISLFMIEGMGFGRGQGVHDLSKNKVGSFMHMLDPGRLNAIAIKEVKAAFNGLRKREILEVADELEQADRKTFDDTVLAAFGIKVSRERIYNSLLSLVAIRQTATQ